MELQGTVKDCAGNVKEVIEIAPKHRAAAPAEVFPVYLRDYVNERLVERLYCIAPTENDAQNIVKALISDYVEWLDSEPIARAERVEITTYEQVKTNLATDYALSKLTADEKFLLKKYFLSGGK